jgi:uracil-DNA glycosylase
MALNLSPEFLVSTGQVHPSWLPALQDCREELGAVELFISSQIALAVQVLPERQNFFRTLKLPADQVKVVIIGQDPYPTPGHAMGLAFSVPNEVSPFPRSLSNIFTELQSDIGCDRPLNGDLTNWADQGVLLLNRVLTVSSGNVGSHRKKGWEQITLELVHLLVSIRPSVVAVLWGKDAQKLEPAFPAGQVILSAHPSPLSASRGFFGSKPFSSVNSKLQTLGVDPISWCLE